MCVLISNSFQLIVRSLKRKKIVIKAIPYYHKIARVIEEKQLALTFQKKYPTYHKSIKVIMTYVRTIKKKKSASNAAVYVHFLFCLFSIHSQKIDTARLVLTFCEPGRLPDGTNPSKKHIKSTLDNVHSIYISTNIIFFFLKQINMDSFFRVTNKLGGGLTLKVHYKSADDDIGLQNASSILMVSLKSVLALVL